MGLTALRRERIESQRFMLRAMTRKHYLNETQKPIFGKSLAQTTHRISEFLPKNRRLRFFFSRCTFPLDFITIFSLSINLFEFPCLVI